MPSALCYQCRVPYNLTKLISSTTITHFHHSPRFILLQSAIFTFVALQIFLHCAALVDLLSCLQQWIWLEVTNHQNFKSRLQGVTKKKKIKSPPCHFLTAFIISFRFAITANSSGKDRINFNVKTKKNCLQFSSKSKESLYRHTNAPINMHRSITYYTHIDGLYRQADKTCKQHFRLQQPKIHQNKQTACTDRVSASWNLSFCSLTSSKSSLTHRGMGVPQ